MIPGTRGVVWSALPRVSYSANFRIALDGADLRAARVLAARLAAGCGARVARVNVWTERAERAAAIAALPETLSLEFFADYPGFQPVPSGWLCGDAKAIEFNVIDADGLCTYLNWSQSAPPGQPRIVMDVIASSEAAQARPPEELARQIAAVYARLGVYPWAPAGGASTRKVVGGGTRVELVNVAFDVLVLHPVLRDTCVRSSLAAKLGHELAREFVPFAAADYAGFAIELEAVSDAQIDMLQAAVCDEPFALYWEKCAEWIDWIRPDGARHDDGLIHYVELAHGYRAFEVPFTAYGPKLLAPGEPALDLVVHAGLDHCGEPRAIEWLAERAGLPPARVTPVQ